MTEREDKTKPSTDLLKLDDGDFKDFRTKATGSSPEEILAMDFDERQRVLDMIGVNLPIPPDSEAN